MIETENKILSIISNNKSAKPVGITSVCSANTYVIKSALLNGKKYNQKVLIESTSNQVDQYGGYTGITPMQFRNLVYKIANDCSFPAENILLGGDHLGPNRWQNEDSKSAMQKAKEQIAAYISAGYTKIHLDASMKCADDGNMDEPLNPQIVAERSAILCEIAEETFNKNPMNREKPVYIIGSDVPPPGGSKTYDSHIKITTVEEVEATIDFTKREFDNKNIIDAWDRVIAVVVQPGVEFGDSSVFEYDTEKAKQLTEYINKKSNLVYEAHSTDYQKKSSLRQMVKDHFAILKVGPWLTFAFREALFALAIIEKEFLSENKSVQLSNLIEVTEQQMLIEPKYWLKYYSGDANEKKFKRKYSLSDRIRYYWTESAVNESIKKLIINLNLHTIPEALLSQFLPNQYFAVINGEISNKPDDLINHKISEILEIYNYATFRGEH